MSNSFDEKLENEKKKESTSDPIQSLTGKDIFCPKCRAKNKFELTLDDVEVSYLCCNCKTELGVYWKTAQDGYVGLVECVNCHQYTFEIHKYCISCGLSNSVIQKSEEVGRKWFSFKNPSGERLFVYHRAETAAGRCAGHSGYKINRKHPQARIVTAIFVICAIALLALVVWLMYLMLTLET